MNLLQRITLERFKKNALEGQIEEYKHLNPMYVSSHGFEQLNARYRIEIVPTYSVKHYPLYKMDLLNLIEYINEAGTVESRVEITPLYIVPIEGLYEDTDDGYYYTTFITAIVKFFKFDVTKRIFKLLKKERLPTIREDESGEAYMNRLANISKGS